MDRLYPQDLDLHTLSPLALAFVGDGVYSLMVRERLLSQANLTEEEEAVFKRGRNAHTARSGADYHRATGLESLFGYLYLAGRIDRVRELFALCVEE